MKYHTKITTLEEFYQTLYSVPSRLTREIATPQSVTQKLLEKLDNPQQSLRSVLVTGSKGKGSAAIMLAALLQEAGLNVGLFSSPHLFDYRERIVINDAMIDQPDLLAFAERVFTAANTLEIKHPDEFPRFFEITTAIAYLYFYEKGVDYAVIEAGIGALTDATNQKAHCLSILTNIEPEHLDIFSNLENVVAEKSGVMRRGIPLILGDLPEDIDQIILDRAAALQVPVTRFRKKFITNNNGFYPFAIGEHVWISDSKSKAENAWIALNAFQKLGVELSDEKKVDALNSVLLPARKEVVSEKPLVVIDGAHTRFSAKSLANYVAKKRPSSPRQQVLLVSFSAVKNIQPVMAAFPNVDKIVVTQATESRSLSPADIQAQLKQLTVLTKKPKIILIENPLKALEKTMQQLKSDDVLVITGSVYLAGLLSQQFR
ncbi:MAG: hypothetical protein CR975_01345 [Gammaproteobacteria bacterium]|nr:MAG: hypothetical protein CR975_01345 [Gammaproteobacteria bacterium]